MTEVFINTNPNDGKPAVCFKNAIITFIEDEKSGVSQRTGNAWKLRNINLMLDHGDGNPADYVRVTLRNKVCDTFNTMRLGPKSVVTIFVDFHISTGQWPRNEINVSQITNS